MKHSLCKCGACGKRGVFAYWGGGDTTSVRCRYCKAYMSFPRYLYPTMQAAANILQASDRPENRP